MKNRRMKLAFLFVLLTAAALPAQDGKHEHAWTYEGDTGPGHWGDLKDEYSTCKVGKNQSPIDIRDAQKADLPAIHFHYRDSPLRIIDNGHTIQVNYSPGSYITVGDKSYELKQFHFHHPSEERVQGKSYDMVVHLVHADSNGRLAVVAVLLDRGTANRTIQQIWTHLPKTQGEEQEIRGVKINAGALLPHDRAYFTYSGSLTTPPCSEGVTWLVLQTPVDISQQQVDIFARIYPNNSRPIQAIGERVVQAGR